MTDTTTSPILGGASYAMSVRGKITPSGMLKSVVGGAVSGAASGVLGFGVGRILARGVSGGFTRHALQRISERGGSRMHALVAKYFGKPLGSRVDSLGRTSINYATKNTKVAVNPRGKIITYIRFTSKWWRL